MRSLDQASFRQFIRSPERPAIVKFYADWCKDCRVIRAPADELAEQYAAHFDFAELDTVAAPELRQAYGVRGIPTFIAFRHGAELDRAPRAGGPFAEVRGRDELEAFLLQLLRTVSPDRGGA